MTTLLFRLVHYLPTAHLTLAMFANLAALWVLIVPLTDVTPEGLAQLTLPRLFARWLTILYLLLAGAVQLRLSRSGHEILAQPSRLWGPYVAIQLVLMLAVLWALVRGFDSRVHVAGLHHGVAALLIVTALSLVFAAIDRLAATGLARAVPKLPDEEPSRGYDGFAIAFLVVAGLLTLAIGYLEVQSLPHTM